MPRDFDREPIVERQKRESRRTGQSSFPNANHQAVHNHYQHLLGDLHPYRQDRDAAVLFGGFSAAYYLSIYPDVRNVFVTTYGAYRHFIMHGIGEKRSPNPFFDPIFYAANHVDLRDFDGLTLLDHWIRHGIKEGRQGCAQFHLRFYLNQHADLVNAFGTNVEGGSYTRAALHYAEYGRSEPRDTGPGVRIALELPKEIVVNNSPRSIFVKDGNSPNTIEVPAGHTYTGPADGICVPATGTVYKMRNMDGCEVTELNTVSCAGVPMLRHSPHLSESVKVQTLGSPPDAGWNPIFAVCQNPPPAPPRPVGSPPERDWHREFREMDRGSYECERMDVFSRTA